MVRNYKRKRPDNPRYTETDLVNAVNDVLNKNKTFRQAQQAYNIPIAVIYHRIKGRRNPIAIMSAGRRPALPSDVEKNVANCLIARARMGWPVDEDELRGLVRDYVISKGLKTPFKDNTPGHDWYLGFMKRHQNLSLKKPEHLQKIRKDARDPFVVYDFYGKLKDLITNKYLDGPEKACFVFNADESGFNSDPSRVRAIGEKGKSLSRVSGGSGRESTTVLACVAADGSHLPPFILFKGNAVQARWTSEKAYPGTLYGASKNGWMEEPHFYHWFLTSFVPYVKDLRLKHCLPNQTALLTFDGHCSHLSVRIVSCALENNIELFRFPSHLTDRIQPLDRCVFGPVKTKWDKILVAHGKAEMGQSSGRLSKRKFVELLGQVWREGITSENIISGFRSTGTFPVNPAMFSEDYFDPLKLERYKNSISSEVELEATEATTTRSSSTDETPSVPDISKKNSPNQILRIFNQTLEEAAVRSTPKTIGDPLPKKVVPRLKQSRYGEVLTTTDVLKKLLEAENKKEMKARKMKRPNKTAEKIGNGKKVKEASRSTSFNTETVSGKNIADENITDEDDLPLTAFINERTRNNMNSVEYKEVKWDDIQTDSFILVKYTTLNRNATQYKYVCIVKQKDDDDGEIAVTGLRSEDRTCSDFYINEIVTSYITIDMVEAILPQPKIKFVGRKIIYSFPGKVDVFEKP